jgi:hypothetical protein
MIDFISNHPFIGHGFGTEPIVYGYYGIDPDSFGLRGTLAFSAYIGLAVQVGLPLTVLFFTPLYYLIYRTARVPAVPRYGLHAFNAVLIAGVTVAVFEGFIYSMGNAQSFPFWVVVMLLIRRLMRRDLKARRELRQKRELS